ncbi:MAG TPA: sigma-70 family RNA polymerase sigma factor [Pyrinomonadaceae bacterium]|nr:sigma-70 family RNA polymerase sigma factor [Pyrinomonadaceae bacterium]
MARNSAIPPESFEEILAWLHPDRELAARMYVQLRHDLTKMFMWRACHDPEGLTDEVFDRVAKKVHDVRRSYEGDVRLYFRAVANNLVKENIKRIRAHVTLDNIDLPKEEITAAEDEVKRMEDCLQSCLQHLNTEKRELILGYYAKEKQAKIDHRSELAQSLGISVETLRVKVYRIRASLEQCIERCLKRER